jgi:DNA-binding response OmpR family regulator
MNRTARILLVDDDVSIQRAVAPLLRSRGYHVDVVSTGLEAVTAVVDNAPDLIVLDLGLPDLEGAEVCRRIRQHTKAPIVILSARSGEAEKVAALDIGADDYVTKPFGPEELLARIRVALRRVFEAEAPEVERVQVGDITVDFGRHHVVRGDEDIRLTPKEFDLLALLAREPGTVVSRAEILQEVWQTTWFGSAKTIDVHVAALRKKLGDPSWIETVRGVGLRLHVPGV